MRHGALALGLIWGCLAVADPRLSKGWRILGAASCWTTDKVTAQKSSEHLQPVDQEFIRTLCARTLGVQLKSARTVR